MKKKFSSFFLVITLVFALTAISFSADRQVNSCTVRVSYAKNGTCTVQETWNIEIGEDDTLPFSRSIDLSDSDIDKPSTISNVTAYVGGVDKTNEIRTGEKNNVFNCVWQGPFEPGVYEFTLCYTLQSAVKLVDDEAHCCFAIHSKTNKSISQNISVEFVMPTELENDEINVTDSSDFAVRSSKNRIVFTSDNAVGQMKFLFNVPKSSFDSEKLPIVTRDKFVSRVVSAVVILLTAVLAAVACFYVINYEKLLRNKFKKKVRFTAKSCGREALNRAFDSFSPAETLKIVMPDRKSDADLFIVTICDLVFREFLIVDDTGFHPNKPTQNPYTRKIKPFEEHAAKFICTYARKNDRSGVKFKEFVDKFNLEVPTIGIFDLLSKKNDDKYFTMFELRAYSKMMRYVYPGKIADSMTKNYRYDTTDLVCAVINEKKLYPKRIISYKPSKRYKYDFFLLRNLYGRGKINQNRPHTEGDNKK